MANTIYEGVYTINYDTFIQVAWKDMKLVCILGPKHPIFGSKIGQHVFLLKTARKSFQFSENDISIGSATNYADPGS